MAPKAFAGFLLSALFLAPLLPAAPVAPLPEGCVPRPSGYVCAWQATFTLASQWSARWVLPESGLALLAIAVEQSSGYHFWEIFDPDGRWLVGETPGGQSEAASEASRTGPSKATSTVLVPFDGRPDHTLLLRRSLSTGLLNAPPFLPTEVRVTVEGTMVTGSRPSGGAAGSAEDPQLPDAAGDSSSGPSTDFLGAWFDQPYLDDGLIVAGMRLAELPTDRSVEPGTVAVRYRITWTLQGHEYQIRWWSGRSCTDGTCSEWNWTGGMTGSGTMSQQVPIQVDEAAGTLQALLPLVGMGAPAAETLFLNLSADVTEFRIGPLDVREDCQPTDAVRCSVADRSDGPALRPFALGGPEVWARLRGGGDLTVAARGPAPWYEAPFAPDNLADTLQISGAALATVTFLAGLLLVRRRRERLARLMDDVDAILDTHRESPAHALSELDALERRFDRMHREGRITQGDHTALMVRIERAGYRLVRGRGGEGA